MKPSWYLNPLVALGAVIASLSIAFAAVHIAPELGQFGVLAIVVGWIGMAVAVATGAYAVYSGARYQRETYVRDDLGA